MDRSARPGRPADISVVDLEELKRDQELRSLYDSSFPSDEREPLEVMFETVACKAGFVLRARDAERTTGMAFAHVLHTPPATLLVYLCVDPTEQSRGLGSALFKRTESTGHTLLRERGTDGLGVVCEIDDPDLATSAEDRQRRVRRESFFRRLGMARVPGRYLQPAVDGIHTVPMLLMFGAGAGLTAPDPAALVRAIYLEKYHAMNGISRASLERLLTA